ncbi:glycosyltransferase family A protein [Desulforhopalus singaporensis]|uniref:glycosyltransferase family A protein n=1 Tax=Desulforhopalus singaporensis TaxID=91360 RepID=UPI000B81E3BE|nr:glycosyltransferase family A protein [Desulforhopalus singaporensis]
MKIDIIIPIYNNINKLNDIITSINSQILPYDANTRIIIVNDGSEKDTYTKLINIFSHLVDDIIHHEKNLGRSSSRNSGCNSGTGKIIILLDSECIPQGKFFILAHLPPVSGKLPHEQKPVIRGGRRFMHEIFTRTERVGVEEDDATAQSVY